MLKPATWPVLAFHLDRTNCATACSFPPSSYLFPFLTYLPPALPQVLVVDCQGRSRATLMGVPVSGPVKRDELLAALTPLLRPAFSPETELLHLAQASGLEAEVRLVDGEVGCWGQPRCGSDSRRIAF